MGVAPVSDDVEVGAVAVHGRRRRCAVRRARIDGRASGGRHERGDHRRDAQSSDGTAEGGPVGDREVPHVADGTRGPSAAASFESSKHDTHSSPGLPSTTAHAGPDAPPIGGRTRRVGRRHEESAVHNDGTDTCPHHMDGELPAGGDHLGGSFGDAPTLESWYPQRLRVELLHRNGIDADPLGADFDYAAAFATIDLDELKREITTLLTTSVDWWPADYGNYGPQMVRMAWHAAGTYRIADGRGGAGYRHAALRPDRQLVGQRQHRQVPAAAAADQAEVRQRPVLGGPDGADRQLLAGADGFAHLRLRRRTAGRVGAGRRHVVGPRGVGPAPGTPGRRHGLA